MFKLHCVLSLFTSDLFQPEQIIINRVIAITIKARLLFFFGFLSVFIVISLILGTTYLRQEIYFLLKVCLIAIIS